MAEEHIWYLACVVQGCEAVPEQRISISGIIPINDKPQEVTADVPVCWEHWKLMTEMVWRGINEPSRATGRGR